MKQKKENNNVEGKKIDQTVGNSYSAKDIYVLKGLEPVRKRPGMYIGSTGIDGLHHLIWEVCDNSLDEVLSGYAKNIEVRILEGEKISVLDDGRGIPVDIHPQTKKSALETVMCTLHAGGKFGGESYKIAGGLHGVGVSVVNALSRWLRVEVCRNGSLYSQEYKFGQPTTEVKKENKCLQTGTKVIFEPDSQIFPKVKFDFKTIVEHLREQAYLTPGVKIKIIDEREGAMPQSHFFYFESGIIAFLNYLARDYSFLTKNLFYTQKEIDNISIEIALGYIDDIESMELSFANNIHTREGGMHLTGFRSALTRTLNDYIRQEKLLKNNENGFLGDDVREGLVSIVSVKLREPQFEGQTKAKLGNPEARTAVEQALGESLKEWLEKNKDDAKKIAEKCFLTSRARQAAKNARENVLRKGVLQSSSLPGKLADCISRKSEESEIFLVEGESAGGSAKSARDRRFQAILPLKGKILNVEKARLDRIMTSEEIRAIIIALGTAIAEDFNLGKLRYQKVIIMSDADVDGAHIRTLLLTLFYRHFYPCIENGNLYIAQPPLYRIQKGKEFHYVYNEEEKEKVIQNFIVKNQSKTEKLSKNKNDKIEKIITTENINEEELNLENITKKPEDSLGLNIQRYKGLGEMNPSQLWETTMDPEQRTLKKVTVEDAEEADRLFDILMGEEVLPRKKFIQAYAQKVKDLDI